MTDRLEVTKTYKLYIDGKFPRSESGRSIAVVAERKGARLGGSGHRSEKGRADEVLAHCCRASRKDLRDAVSAARKALPGWRDATAYLRAQIMYRMAEMMEGKRDEFVRGLSGGTRVSSAKGSTVSSSSADAEVTAAIDRLVAFAGWADKYAQVLGCNNAVAGPYYNFTVPEPTGVVAVVAPDEPALLGLISLLAPVLCAGNTAVAIGGKSSAGLLATSILGEVMATSDVPAGVVNLLTGDRDELIQHIATHRDIDAVHAAAGPGGVSAEQRATLRAGAAENLKRVTIRDASNGGNTGSTGKATRLARASKPSGTSRGVDYFDVEACQTPWWIEPFVEMKTIWHPSAM